MRRDISKIIEDFKQNDSTKEIFNDEGEYPIVKILTVTDDMVNGVNKLKSKAEPIAQQKQHSSSVS